MRDLIWLLSATMMRCEGAWQGQCGVAVLAILQNSKIVEELRKFFDLDLPREILVVGVNKARREEN